MLPQGGIRDPIVPQRDWQLPQTLETLLAFLFFPSCLSSKMLPKYVHGLLSPLQKKLPRAIISVWLADLFPSFCNGAWHTTAARHTFAERLKGKLACSWRASTCLHPLRRGRAKRQTAEALQPAHRGAEPRSGVWARGRACQVHHPPDHRGQPHFPES